MPSDHGAVLPCSMVPSSARSLSETDFSRRAIVEFRFLPALQCGYVVLVGSVADNPAVVHRRTSGVLLGDDDPVFGLTVD